MINLWEKKLEKIIILLKINSLVQRKIFFFFLHFHFNNNHKKKNFLDNSVSCNECVTKTTDRLILNSIDSH